MDRLTIVQQEKEVKEVGTGGGREAGVGGGAGEDKIRGRPTEFYAAWSGEKFDSYNKTGNMFRSKGPFLESPETL